jgi:hypothetical protein
MFIPNSGWFMTFRGKRTGVPNSEVKYYALDKKDAFSAINTDEIDYFRLEIDYTKKPYMPYEDISEREANPNQFAHEAGKIDRPA